MARHPNENDSRPLQVNLLGEDTADISYYYNTDGGGDYTQAFNGQKDAGIYYIKAIIDDPDPIIVNNYELWVRYATLTIDIRTITVTSTSAAADWTKVYDSTDDYYDYILTGICASDITKLSHYAKYNNKNAESGKTISFYLTDNNPLDKVAHNYLINDITDGVILKKELRLYEEIIWSKVYDGVIMYTQNRRNGNIRFDVMFARRIRYIHRRFGVHFGVLRQQKRQQ